MGKIEDLGREIQERIVKLSAEGMSNGAIADEINMAHGSDLNDGEVYNYLKKFRGKSVGLLKEDKNFQKQLLRQYFDAVEQLKQLNSQMWKFFYESRTEMKPKKVKCPHCNKDFDIQIKDWNALIKMADHLLTQIKHVDEVLGKTQKKSLTVNYNIVDLSKKMSLVMPKMMKEMEKRGIIKLNKKKMNNYYVGSSRDEEEEIEN